MPQQLLDILESNSDNESDMELSCDDDELGTEADNMVDTVFEEDEEEDEEEED